MYQRLPSFIIPLATAALVFAWSPAAQAQVHITMAGDTIILDSNEDDTEATRSVLQRTHTKDGQGWVLTALDGTPYETGTFLGRTTGGSGSAGSEQIILASGYEGRTTGGSGSAGSEQIILASGYEGALDILVTSYGAVIEHDVDLGVDIITFPSADDPILTFVTALLTETYNDRPLIDYFALVEIPTVGLFDEPAYNPIKTPAPHSFPDDTYYKVDWGFKATYFDHLVWHTALAKKSVKVSVIDSGVRPDFQDHNGLDGVAIQHMALAPSLDQNLPHALGILTLLGDQGHDESGIVGLLASWDSKECTSNTTLFDAVTPQVLSYNVGDVAPSSYYVARAIHESITAGADVINLSLKLPYSSTVEEAIQTALDAGVIVVAAGGNYDSTETMTTTFPASMAGVIAVGAGTKNRKFASFSAQHGVDIVAPGKEIIVGRTDGEWQYANGTSYATAYVTATAAFMRAVNPTVTSAEVLAALQSTSTQPQKTNGVGFLNAFDAVNAILPSAEQAIKGNVKQPKGCNDSDEQNRLWNPNVQLNLTGEQRVSTSNEVPTEFALAQNYPNPFNPTTTLGFDLPEAAVVSLRIYDLLGREIEPLLHQTLEAGTHKLTWNASQVPSGTYIYHLEAGSYTSSNTMVLLK